MNPKMNNTMAVLKVLAAGMMVHINGNVYYMSDSVLYYDRKGMGVHVSTSLNSFVDICGSMTNQEVQAITTKFEKWSKN